MRSAGRRTPRVTSRRCGTVTPALAAGMHHQPRARRGDHGRDPGRIGRPSRMRRWGREWRSRWPRRYWRVRAGPRPWSGCCPGSGCRLNAHAPGQPQRLGFPARPLRHRHHQAPSEGGREGERRAAGRGAAAARAGRAGRFATGLRARWIAPPRPAPDLMVMRTRHDRGRRQRGTYARDVGRTHGRDKPSWPEHRSPLAGRH